jgi:hypothetical protein
MGTKRIKTYNTRDSLVVTDPTTDLALTSLTRGERTGSRTFSWIWSYVIFRSGKVDCLAATEMKRLRPGSIRTVDYRHR